MPGSASRLTVYLTEDDRVGHQEAWKALIERARADGMAGATVWRGIEGFGQRRLLRSSRFVDAAVGLPVAVEVIDDEERVRAFLPAIAQLVPGCLVVCSPVEASVGSDAAGDWAAGRRDAEEAGSQ